jgi:hypothetical protein
MSNVAKVEHGYVNVKYSATIEGVQCAVVGCADYDVYKHLPAAVSFEGRLLGKTGWNSDNGEAYYQSNASIAKVVHT